MSISHLVYASKATAEIDDNQLRSIQSSAIRNNGPLEITGLLLYGRRWFIQLLEGDWDVLESTFENICKDDRHENIEVLFRGPSEKRLFPTWSMGVISMDHSEIHLDIKGMWNQLDVSQAVKNGDSQPFYQLFEMFQRNVNQVPQTA